MLPDGEPPQPRRRPDQNGEGTLKIEGFPSFVADELEQKGKGKGKKNRTRTRGHKGYHG